MSFCLWLCQQQTRVRSSESIKLWHGERKARLYFISYAHRHAHWLSHCSMRYSQRFTVPHAYFCFSLSAALRSVSAVAFLCVHLFLMKSPFLALHRPFSLSLSRARLSHMPKPVFRVSFCSNGNNDWGNMKMLIAFANCQWHQWSTSTHHLFCFF